MLESVKQLKTNYHTHTTFCDGKDSPEKMVQTAIEKGFDILGFSAHSIYPLENEWHLDVKQYTEYAETIAALKAKYRGKIEILTGYEVDYLPPLCVPNRKTYAALGAEYIIGSVHYITTDRKGEENTAFPTDYFTVDGPVEEVAHGIETIFGGDGKKAVQTYFATEREMLRHGEFDIAGHLDVIRKRNSVLHFFDESEDWYKREIEATAESAAHSGIIVEINTGGIARGAIDDTYPSADFLRELKKHDVPVMINSDAHEAAHLDAAFDLAKKRATDAGYRETVYLRDGEIFSQPIL
jgi:histidinol-phosphatase (PHP family)